MFPEAQSSHISGLTVVSIVRSGKRDIPVNVLALNLRLRREDRFFQAEFIEYLFAKDRSKVLSVTFQRSTECLVVSVGVMTSFTGLVVGFKFHGYFYDFAGRDRFWTDFHSPLS